MALSPFVNTLGFVALPPKKIGASLRGAPILFGGRLFVLGAFNCFGDIGLRPFKLLCGMTKSGRVCLTRVIFRAFLFNISVNTPKLHVKKALFMVTTMGATDFEDAGGQFMLACSALLFMHWEELITPYFQVVWFNSIQTCNGVFMFGCNGGKINP